MEKRMAQCDVLNLFKRHKFLDVAEMRDMLKNKAGFSAVSSNARRLVGSKDLICLTTTYNNHIRYVYVLPENSKEVFDTLLTKYGKCKLYVPTYKHGIKSIY